MEKRKVFGISFIFISFLFSLAGILSSNITGAVIGLEINNSFFIILTLAFLLLGLLFLSRVGKGLAALVLTGTALWGGHKLINSNQNYEKINTKQIQSVEITKPWDSDAGRFQRTYRYDVPLDIIEQKYGIPQGILKGLMMQESYGDPTRLNESGDGGAGPFMIQPGTAQYLGLKIYGDSKIMSIDKKHGRELKELVKKYHNDYGKLAEIDERFDIEKSADAAARYLLEFHNKYQKKYTKKSDKELWDMAVSAYNRGQSAKNPEKTPHVKAVRKFQDIYNKNDKEDYYRLYKKGKIKNFKL